MSKLPIKSIEGADKGAYELPDELLVYDKGSQAMASGVTAFRAAQRGGNASTKTKAEVRGTGAKPWKQKGLGRARAGYRQSPIWRGGGVAFGPKPRDYRKSQNKKTARLAFRRSVSEKVASGQVTVVENFDFEKPSTKRFSQLLAQLEARGPILFVFEQASDNVALSARNISNLEIARAQDLNVYQVLRYPTIFITQSGMQVLESRMQAHVRKSS